MALGFNTGDDTGDADVTAEINITPLIDVMLVLLVMLIITIPFQLQSVEVELPTGTPPPQALEPLVVNIAVTPASQWLWNGEPVPDRVTLDARLQAAAQLPQQPEIHVQPHRLAKYEQVAAVLTSAQRLGLQKIGVVGLEQMGP